MGKKKTKKAIKDDPVLSKLDLQDKFHMDVTELIRKEMEKMKIGKAGLAKLTGIKKKRIKQFFCGSKDIALRTLSDICFQLGCKPVISLQLYDNSNKDEELIPEPEKARTFQEQMEVTGEDNEDVKCTEDAVGSVG